MHKKDLDNSHVEGAMSYIPMDWLWPLFPWWLYIQLRASFALSVTSIKRQKTKGNKAKALQWVHTGHKGCQNHSQTRGAAPTVTLHTSQSTNSSLLIRGPPWKMRDQESFVKHAKIFLLQFICNLLYYLISYAQMNNSKFLFLYQFVRTSVTNVCVCVCEWVPDCDTWRSVDRNSTFPTWFFSHNTKFFWNCNLFFS